MNSPKKLLKGAELASGLGAIFLGAGIALLAPDRVRSLAGPLLLAGVGIHGAGMALKYRLEHHDGAPWWWERVLYWGCWAVLIGLLGWLTTTWLTGGISVGA